MLNFKIDFFPPKNGIYRLNVYIKTNLLIHFINKIVYRIIIGDFA